MALIQPFHVRLTLAINANGIDATKACKLVFTKTKRNISPRSMRRYVTGEIVPDYLKAKDILSAFNFKIDEMELRKSLELSKQQRELFNMSRSRHYTSIDKSIRIKLVGMIEGLSPEDTNRLLSERIGLLLGDPGEITTYINMLIKKDLEEYLTTKEY